MKKSLFFSMFAVTVGLGILTACNNNNSGATAPINSTIPYCPGGPNTCVYNSAIPSAQYPMNTTVGFRSQTGQANYGNIYQQPYQPQGNMQVTSAFVNVLKLAMGVCDQYSSTGGSNYGMTACSSWLGGQHSVAFGMNSASSSGVQLTIKSNYIMNPTMNYWANIPSPMNFALGFLGLPTYQTMQGTFNPMILNGTIYPIANSQGFEIRATAPTGSAVPNQLFQLQVLNGKVQDPSVPFILLFNGAQVANGTMGNCGSSSCAMGY